MFNFKYTLAEHMHCISNDLLNMYQNMYTKKTLTISYTYSSTINMYINSTMCGKVTPWGIFFWLIY